MRYLLMLGLFAVLLFTVPVRAQDVSNIYMGGVSYSYGGSPAVAGTGMYAHQLTTVGTYAFTMVDALPTNSKTFTTNVAIGVAQKVATIAGVPIFVPTAAGVSLTGTNAGWAWSTGAGAPFALKNGWYVMPTIRVLKSSVAAGTGYQPVVGVLVGWGK